MEARSESAVAVARGHADFTFGTDTAGSGRVPASLNNLVGYKPLVSFVGPKRYNEDMLDIISGGDRHALPNLNKLSRKYR